MFVAQLERKKEVNCAFFNDFDVCQSVMTLPPVSLLEQPTVAHCWRD
jgi:hypothetical protein